MMHISIILAHPRAQSLNHAIAGSAAEQRRANGHTALLHDLYAEGFLPLIGADEAETWRSGDPLVEQHCAEIARADGIIIVHPNWWGQPPAILKGWVDRVLRPGVAYDWGPNDRGEGIPRGLLRARAALVFNTANTPWPREQAVFGNPLDLLWRDCIFGLCGVQTYARKVFSVVATSAPDERAAWLEDVRQIVTSHFPPEPVVTKRGFYEMAP